MKVPNFLNRDRDREDSLEAGLPLEESIPLEESAPLESAREIITLPVGRSHQAAQPTPSPEIEPPQPAVSVLSQPAPVVERATIPLLEERLAVDYHRRKIGEVVVRKEIQVQTIQVPVRREKLIVEQISPEPKELASVVLQESNSEFARSTDVNQPSVTAEFNSAKEASQFLQAIAERADLNRQKVQVNLLLADPQLLDVYQQWLQHDAPNRRSRSPVEVRLEETTI